MTNDERVAAYMRRPGGQRSVVWTVAHAADSCGTGGPHGHWYPVTPAQRRRLAKHANRLKAARR